MLTTAKLSPFTISQRQSNEKLFKKNKFTNHIISPLDQYHRQMNNHQYQLKKKFPAIELNYIRSLLEELDNNFQMVSDILEDEQKKIEKHAMEEEDKHENDSINEDRKDKLNSVKFDDIKILKSSLAKLYTKLKQEQKQKQDLSKKVIQLSKQNENLKLVNKQLIEQQTQSYKLIQNLDIC